MVGIILLILIALLIGGVVGGYIVYVANVHKWRSLDMDEVFECVARIESNEQKLHENMKHMAQSFDEHVDTVQKSMNQVENHVAKIDLDIRHTVRDTAAMIRVIEDTQTDIAPKIGVIYDTICVSNDVVTNEVMNNA